MKHSLLFLTVYLMSSTQYSFCQTNKLDELAVKGASLVSSKLPAAVNNMQANEPAKPHGVMAKADMGTNAVTKPQYNGSKTPSIASHTQLLQRTTETLETNTDALVANTRALQANTEAMQANIRAAQTNANYRMHQRQQADINAALPTKTVPVYSPAVMVKNNAQTAAPAPQPARTAVKPMTLAATLPRPATKPLPAPGTLLREVKPQSIVTKAPVKPAPAMSVAVVAPKAPVVKPAPAPAIRVAVVAPKAPVKPAAPAAEVRTISTMPVAAAPAKPAVKAPVARVENGRLVSTMPMPEPMHKAQDQNNTLPLQARIANPSIKAMQRTPGSISLNYLMRMPMLDASYEVANGTAKPVAVASRSGLKEGDMITTQGYLRVIATEDSGKANEAYVLQIAAHINGVDSCFVVKIPSNQSGAMTTKETADNAKKFIKENLVKGKVPCSGGNLMRNPVYVSITGKLAYNTGRAKVMRNMKDGNKVKRDMSAYTPWEIHSIRNIEFSLP
jgi:hypothetical protein